MAKDLLDCWRRWGQIGRLPGAMMRRSWIAWAGMGRAGPAEAGVATDTEETRIGLPFQANQMGRAGLAAAGIVTRHRTCTQLMHIDWREANVHKASGVEGQRVPVTRTCPSESRSGAAESRSRLGLARDSDLAADDISLLECCTTIGPARMLLSLQE
jgi:hypothetical protein